MYMCACVCLYENVYVCVKTCMCECVDSCIYIMVYMYPPSTYVCACCVRVMYVCECTYACVYVFVYVGTYLFVYECT